MSTSHDAYGAVYLPQAATTATTATTEVKAQGDTWPWAKAARLSPWPPGARAAP
jgi:hypothetical protein